MLQRTCGTLHRIFQSLSTLTHALLLPLLQKVQTLNPLVSLTALSTKWVKPAGAKSVKRRNLDETCGYCKIVGHNIHDCRKLETVKAATPQPQDVSFSTSAYLSACAVHEAGR